MSKMYQKNCITCNELYTGTAWSKYCTPCAKLARKKQNKEWREKNSRILSKKSKSSKCSETNPKVCLNCKKPFCNAKSLPYVSKEETEYMKASGLNESAIKNKRLKNVKAM